MFLSQVLSQVQTYFYNMIFISARNSLHSYREFIKSFFVPIDQEKHFSGLYSSVGDIKKHRNCFGGPFIFDPCPPE